MADEITVGEVSRRVDRAERDIERLRDGQDDRIARAVATAVGPIAENLGEVKRDLDKHQEWHDNQSSQRVNLTWQKAGVYMAVATCLVGVATWAITLLVTHGR